MKGVRVHPTTTKWMVALSLSGSAFFQTPVARAQCADRVAEIDSTHPLAGDQFGHDVDVKGEVAIVGALFHDDVATDAGSAYIYRLDGLDWVAESELNASDGKTQDRFGNSVAIDGDAAVVGAHLHDAVCPADPDCNSGAVYVFRMHESAWHQEKKLTASDASAGAQFGAAVDLDGDVLVVGAVVDGAVSRGSAYVFRFDGAIWVEEAKLTASDAADGDVFGGAVAIDGDVIVVGATYGGGAVADSGSAYVYRFDGTQWIQEAELTSSDAEQIEWFGWSVAVDGDVAVVSSLLDDDGGSGSGSADVFRYAGGVWAEEDKLVAADAAPDDAFGISVGLSGDLALIGAYGDNALGAPAFGTAYVYEFDGANWQNLEKLRVPDPDDGVSYQFGWSVALDSNVALVGAPYDNGLGVDVGSAFVFLLESDCNANGIDDACDLEDGTSTDDNANGIPDECDEPVCEGDANGDGVIDPLDVGFVQSRFSCSVGTGNAECDAADQNGDGAVDPLDSGYVLSRFGDCP